MNALCVHLLRVSVGQCPNLCSGIGTCNGYGQCTCPSDRTGADCSLRVCPSGSAWWDYPSAIDTAHASVECSNMGICDRKTGQCKCRSGFEGPACERMSCPGSTAEARYPKGQWLNVPECSGNGVCMSMAEAAENWDGVSLTNVTTYSLWDANKIYGCVCDDGFYGYDCSLQYCPLGDDPHTAGQQDESQMIFCTCDGCTGTWTYSYRGEVTAPIAYNADAATVDAAIEALSTVTAVTTTFSGSTACEAGGNLITITFTNDPGDLNPGRVVSLLTGGSNSLYMRTVQSLTCTCPDTCSGSLILKYRGQETSPIPYSAAAADVDAALETLSTIDTGGISVNYNSGSALCAASAVTTSITFTSSVTGNVPKVEVVSALASTAGTPTAVVTTHDGTKEGAECSNRGTCMGGSCACYLYYTNAAFVETNYTSSDGAGNAGRKGDCGRVETAVHSSSSQTGCPWRMYQNVFVSPAGDENYTCSGHGHCDSSTFVCSCSEGWRGGDCSERVCPGGRAWFDEASDTNVAHHRDTECSNRGICDRATGACKCMKGFTGAACDRLGCASDVGLGECNDNGICLSMKHLAPLATSGGVLSGYTYGATPNHMATWDADMIYGCYCHDGYYTKPDRSGYISYYCSQPTCPYGDNPSTPTLEVQTLVCTATSGTFALTFNDGVKAQTTSAITFDAVSNAVDSALEALSSIRAVTVSYSSGAAACTAGGANTMRVTFQSNLGDLADLTYDVTALQGGAGTIAVAEATKGTTSQNFETQKLTCTATSGTFALTFRGATTTSIAYDAAATVLEAALEYMPTIMDVDVSYNSGTAACSAAGVEISVTFKTELGDVPAITATTTALQAGAGTVAIAESQKGDKDNVVCSEKGVCDQDTGVCKCFKEYGSSDHNGNEGARRDCGKNNPMIGYIPPPEF